VHRNQISHLRTQFLEYGVDSALLIKGKHWHAEDMVLKPESFLDGVGEGGFGTQHGLELWLQLDADGWMETGLPYVGVRQIFEDALEDRGRRRT
jgi:hypothetical protein